MDASYLLQGCEKCPCTDKSRPYNVRTLVDLLKVHFQNFSHFGTPNKSQTRNFNMFFYLTSGSDEGLLLDLALLLDEFLYLRTESREIIFYYIPYLPRRNHIVAMN